MKTSILRVLFVILAIALSLSFVVCGGGGGGDDDDANDSDDALVEEYQEIQDANDRTDEQIVSKMKELLAEDEELSAALESTVDFANELSNVQNARVATGNRGIVVEHDQGLFSYLDFKPFGVEDAYASKMNLKNDKATSSLRALIMKADTGVTYSGPASVRALFPNSEYLTGEQVTPEVLGDWAEYDVVYFNGHGMADDTTSGICTGVPLDDESIDKYVALYQWLPFGEYRFFACDGFLREKTLGVTEGFFQVEFAGKADSMVYIDSCEVLAEEHIPSAIIDKGPAIVWGWDWLVSSATFGGMKRNVESIFESLISGQDASTALENRPNDWNFANLSYFPASAGSYKLPVDDSANMGDDDTGDDDDYNDQVLIPAGNFWMGCEPEDDECDSNESPRHEVYLSAYYIDVYEVTNERYAAFLNANGNECDGYECADEDSLYIRVHESGGVWSADTGYEDHPMVDVSWYGARSFCEWTGGRLPTEAEWEKAAKGAGEHYIYPWGDTWIANAANYSYSGDPWDDEVWPKTTPVGYFDGSDHGGTYQTADGRSPYGLHDMAGNVWEWVNDWYDYDYYDDSPSVDPTGPATGSSRVLRGGSWDDDPGDVRASLRSRLSPTNRRSNLGFRCSRDLN
ncbi:MAG: formylglycine-generating enzyme family protein [Deltaproteobacteria bacterium]|nr:formylglycine-generating enzyme family protein [Deltaproteobacteria bacterium]MCB9489913.1 formylglycine-generating enzyme family protein [Deltaproteobacteria bacterium]